MHVIELEHSTSTGHRIPGHEGGAGKCARLHGHTYTFKVMLSSEVLDENGFVADFGAIKRLLDEWDHRLLLHDGDALEFGIHGVEGSLALGSAAGYYDSGQEVDELLGVLRVPFVPTAENMSVHLAERFLRAFDNVVFTEVEVRESPLTVARRYCSRSDLA